MIILDTNVISQMTRDLTPIEAWFDNQRVSDMHITTTTVTEIIYGLERLPPGRAREFLTQRWQSFETAYSDRTLGITPDIAHLAGQVLAVRESIGRRIHLSDAQIAATAIRHRATLATRNTKDFEGLGITLINPWD